MPTDIKVIHARDFIKATPEGHFDFKKSKQVLIEIASVSASCDNCEIILDTRKAEIKVSVTDLWHLAAELSNYRKEFSQNIAVLCPLEGFDNAEFFSLCAQNRGFKVSAFTSFDDAIEWLMQTGSGA